MTRNFQRLIEVAGPSNLATALDLTEKRIADIAAGNFTVETAHHIEQTLGLPGNFMEQVNPELTEDLVRRLKSPFDSKNDQSYEEPEPAASEPVQPAPVVRTAAPVQLHLVPNIAAPDAASPQVDEQVTEQHQESEMAKAAQKGAPAKTAAKKQPAAKKATQQSLLPAESDLDVEEVRRENLKLLTARLGSKGIVCVLTGMTPANLSHRLAGLKRFDDETANLFTKGLHLPEGWISTPHKSEKDIPKKVYEMLDPQGVNKGMKPEKKAATEKPAAGKKATAKTPAAKKIAAKSAAPRERVLAPADVSAPRLSAGVLGRKSATVAAPVAEPRTTAVAASTRAAPPASAEATRHEPAAEVAVAPARVAAPAAAPVSVVEPDELQALHPITVALIKMLVMKAREDRIDVPTAINLLTEVSKL